MGQNNNPIRTFDSTIYYTNYDSLKNLLVNKEFPEWAELPIIIALLYFPELDSTLIECKERRITTTLNARPSLGSLIFKNKSKRKYVIRINNSPKADKILINEVPYNALIGLFGHEFSHILDYLNKSTSQVIKIGLGYLNKKTKEKFEKEIDKITIDKGLGWQLYDFTDYILNNSDASEKYKTFTKDIYLEPFEIEELIKADSSYNIIQIQ